MLGLALVLLYVAVVCGFGDTNLGTAVHNSADFLFWWYLVCSSIGTLIVTCVGGLGGLLVVAGDSSDKKQGAIISISMFVIALWVMFRTVLTTAGCWLISLGVPVESAPADWNWTKTGIGFALILFTLIVLRSRGNNKETKTQE